MTFLEKLESSPVILADGGVETRIMYEFKIDLPEFASFQLILDEQKRPIMDQIFAEYIGVAREARLPLQLGLPTWRTNPRFLRQLGFEPARDTLRITRACHDWLHRLLEKEHFPRRQTLISGVLGPGSDGYQPARAMGTQDAYDYHRPLAEIYAALDVDFLYAPTFCARSELLGVCRAMADSGKPYSTAMVIDGEGKLLDGTPIEILMEEIDATFKPKPFFFYVGCVHPKIFLSATASMRARGARNLHRLRGLKSNGAALTPKQLDRLRHLATDEPAEFAKLMMESCQTMNLKVLGGCCGTDARHISQIAKLLKPTPGHNE